MNHKLIFQHFKIIISCPCDICDNFSSWTLDVNLDKNCDASVRHSLPLNFIKKRFASAQNYSCIF